MWVITEVWRRRLTGEALGGVGMSPDGASGEEERQGVCWLGVRTLELAQLQLGSAASFLIPM